MSHSDWCWACQHVYGHEDDSDESFYDLSAWHDVNVIASRLPADDLTMNEVAAYFGVDRNSIYRALKAGRLQPAAWREEFSDAGHWTSLQVALSVFNGGVRVPPKPPQPCGTPAAYARHRRDNEKCFICRLGANRYRREYDQDRKR